jgi:hypothetical protein
MATVDHRATVDRIIATNGEEYADEPPVLKIVEYTNVGNRQCWGVVWDGDPDPDRYERPSDWIRDPVVIWRRRT